METKYWLSRQRAAIAMARAATSSRARLAHFELAGRYSLKAADALPASGLARRMAVSKIIASSRDQEALAAANSDAFYYECLEQGAGYLAALATSPEQRAEHLRAGMLYARRAAEAAH